MADQNKPFGENSQTGGSSTGSKIDEGSAIPTEISGVPAEPVQNPAVSEIPFPPTEISADFSGASNISGENYPQSPVFQMPPPPATPTVIVPSSSGSIPKWFYLIFVIVLIVFIAVTVLLVLSMKSQKQVSLPIAVPTLVPTVENVSVPTKTPVPVPSISITPQVSATDAAILKLDKIGSSDEVGEIESDINETDLSSIDQDLTSLDKDFDVTSGIN